MPYKSEAQRRFFNSEKGKEVVGEKNVKEFNKESKGLDLPEKVEEKDEDEILNKRIPTMGKANDTNRLILKAISSIEKLKIMNYEK